ncbi:hypothetical protein O4H49_02600 [Kiloniella laminariae]|uniref:SMODS and SLOG-associating 2TM effector domain-containing protein n=1 Tax=Kiloniella laminariae TaxID=454162 RepID=A0ABT4LEX4_9PROT|nr:hypothetical protein [Kiloniella laminariae]MCZ4279651.1 hypothetical protein [Kiloniella laminariae]
MAKRDFLGLMADHAVIDMAEAAWITNDHLEKINWKVSQLALQQERDRLNRELLESHRAALFEINNFLEGWEEDDHPGLTPSEEMSQLYSFKHYLARLEQSDFPDLSDKEYLEKTRQRVNGLWKATSATYGPRLAEAVEESGELQKKLSELKQLYPLMYVRDQMAAKRFWFGREITFLKFALGISGCLLLLLLRGNSTSGFIIEPVVAGSLTFFGLLILLIQLQKSKARRLRAELEYICDEGGYPLPDIRAYRFNLEGMIRTLREDIGAIVFSKWPVRHGPSGLSERQGAVLDAAWLMDIIVDTKNRLMALKQEYRTLDRKLDAR